MLKNDTYVQNSKGRCRHRKEINRKGIEHVIFQECSPCLRWRLAGSEFPDDLGNSSFMNFNPQLHKFPVHTRCAPKRICLRVPAKITSQSWRPDLGQICSIRNRKTTVIAGYFEDFAIFESDEDDLKTRCENVKLFMREPLAISSMSLRISESMDGRPVLLFFDLNRQKSLNPFRCQRITVSG